MTARFKQPVRRQVSVTLVSRRADGCRVEYTCTATMFQKPGCGHTWRTNLKMSPAAVDKMLAHWAGKAATGVCPACSRTAAVAAELSHHPHQPPPRTRKGRG